MKLPLIPVDKANHALYGAAIFSATFVATTWSGRAQWALLAGVAATLAFAVGKEAMDYLLNRRAARAGLAAPHGVELADALATCGGAALCAASVLAGRLA